MLCPFPKGRCFFFHCFLLHPLFCRPFSSLFRALVYLCFREDCDGSPLHWRHDLLRPSPSSNLVTSFPFTLPTVPHVKCPPVDPIFLIISVLFAVFSFSGFYVALSILPAFGRLLDCRRLPVNFFFTPFPFDPGLPSPRTLPFWYASPGNPPPR